MGKNMILVNQLKIPKNAEKYIQECLNTSWISSQGKYVELFEKNFAKYVGVKYATATNSGTSALHLALLALKIREGDEVIVPASTIGSCYFAIWYVGARAIPIDAEPNTYNINPELIEKNITAKTKAIMMVHLFGHPCNIDPIKKIAKKYKLKIIEDAAESHGAEYKGKKTGSFGDVACFSFYANKIVTTGEGGMLITNNKKYWQRSVNLKTLSPTKESKFIHSQIGYKYLMTNLQAAMGVASLEEVEKSIVYKRKIASFYHQKLKNINGIILPSEEKYAKSVYWMYAVLIDQKRFGIDRDELMKILKEKYNIQTRTFFYPPNIAFKKLDLYLNQKFPIAEKIAKQGLYLPSGLGNTLKEIRFVCQSIIEIKNTLKNH